MNHTCCQKISRNGPRCLSNDWFNNVSLFCRVFADVKNGQCHRTGDENRRISQNSTLGTGQLWHRVIRTGIPPGQILRIVFILTNQIKETNYPIPSSKSETNLTGVLFHDWIQKSLRIKFHRVRVDFWIMQHEPGMEKYILVPVIPHVLRFTKYWQLLWHLLVSGSRHVYYLPSRDEVDLRVSTSWLRNVCKSVQRGEFYRWARQCASALFRVLWRLYMEDSLYQTSAVICRFQPQHQALPEPFEQHQDKES